MYIKFHRYIFGKKIAPQSVQWIKCDFIFNESTLIKP